MNFVVQIVNLHFIVQVALVELVTLARLHHTETDTDVAGPLVEMLAKASIPVPDWLGDAGASGGGAGDAGDEDEDWG